MGKEYLRQEGRSYNYERDKNGGKVVWDEDVQETVFPEHEVKHQTR
jgi:hypothetical protein